MKSVTVKVQFEKEIEIDIIKEITKYNAIHKWNVISELLNNFSIYDIEFIPKAKRKILSQFLQHQSKRFNE